jgi:lipoprotein-anchoring transpeptidase ErfK/SrfK
MRMALRDHPWPLESYVDRLFADCRTGPGASVFVADLQALDAQFKDAKKCLAEAGDAWAIRRDYTPCVQKLLNVALIAFRIRLDQALRVQGEKARLNTILKTLEADLGTDSQSPKPAAKIEVKNANQSRARTLFKTARNLAALGQTSSALVAALGAQGAWAESESFMAAELARFQDLQLRAVWEKAAQALLRWTRQTGRSAILVDKLEHRCLFLTNGRVAKTYVADLSRNWHRIKLQEYDASTPEGEYKIRQKIPATNFGAALLLDYPNTEDWRRFNSLKRAGTIGARARIGGAIEIHGGGRRSDWTDGCVALENADMEDLFKRAYVGMPVTIVGTSSVGNTRMQEF